MNRNDSLGTARIALSVALVMVLAAVVIPLPRPPRPVVAARGAAGIPRNEPRPVATPVLPAVPGGAAAPRLAARDGRSTPDAPASNAPRKLAPETSTVKATPLHPIDVPADKPAETLPPPPRDVVTEDETARTVKAPRIQLGPIDDTRLRRGARASGQGNAPAKSDEPDERRVQVNVVLDPNAMQSAGSGDREAVARLEARIESLQQRLDELARLRAEAAAVESRENARLLERVEQMMSMTEIQRRIDTLQTTLEETKREQSHQESLRRIADAAAPSAESPPSNASETESNGDAKAGSTGAAAAPAVTTASPSSAAPEAAGSDQPGLPQILPGPPFAPRPGERPPTFAPASRGARVRQALGTLASNDGTVDGADDGSMTPVVQVTRRTPTPAPAGSSPAPVEPMAGTSDEGRPVLPTTGEAPLDLASEPMAHESSCYEYQLASRCYARGDLMQARSHVRRAIAYAPTLQAPRQLSERIELALRGVHRSGPSSEPSPAPAARAVPTPAEPMKPSGWIEFPSGPSKPVPVTRGEASLPIEDALSTPDGAAMP